MKILVVSEGARDVGVDDASDGAVAVLVRRVLEQQIGRSLSEVEVVRARLPRVHRLSSTVSGYARKVQLAIVEAQAQECTAVAIVVDRDGPRNRGRLQLLLDGRDTAASNGLDLAESTALGIAVETVEAWLLADIKAINDACRAGEPADECADPERTWGPKGSERHPKAKFLSLIDSPRTAYEAVASGVRLDILEKRCPEGFGRFAEEIRTRCC